VIGFFATVSSSLFFSTIAFFNSVSASICDFSACFNFSASDVDTFDKDGVLEDDVVGLVAVVVGDKRREHAMIATANFNILIRSMIQ
jgi:hypothetical protein